MIPAGLFAAAVVLALLLTPVAFAELLYIESARLRTRETRALNFFKNTLEERLKFDVDRGVLALSLVKHLSLAAIAALLLAASLTGGSTLLAAFLKTCLVSGAVILICGHLGPQLLYRRTRGEWLLPFVPPIRFLALAVRPLSFTLEFIRQLAEPEESLGNSAEQPSPAEEIDALIDAGTEEGLIEEDDRKLIQSVVAFGDKTVREVMTPRPNIVAAPADWTVEEFRQLVINEQYSRIPVHEGSIDGIIGFVHVRDMFELDSGERSRRTVRDLVRPISFVPETKPADDLLREMQQEGAHMAIVVDEYGNTAGLATLEDLVEVIVGEIRDEHEPEIDVKEDASGGFLVSGSFDVGRLQDLVGFRPTGEIESTTVGGLVTEWLGRVPPAGERVEREGIRIEVLASNELRIERVRVSRAGEHQQ